MAPSYEFSLRARKSMAFNLFDTASASVFRPQVLGCGRYDKFFLTGFSAKSEACNTRVGSEARKSPDHGTCGSAFAIPDKNRRVAPMRSEAVRGSAPLTR